MNKYALTTAISRFILELERLAKATHKAEDRLLYETFLARASVIIAKVVQDQPIGDDIVSMDRMYGNTWFRDDDAFKKAYSEWDTFKGLLTQSIYGMTVNERLFTLDLVDEFDDAVARGDESRARGILLKCFLDVHDIDAIIERHFEKKE